MKKLIFTAVLLSFKMFSQDTIYFPKVDDFKRTYVEIGIEKPKNELSNKYEESYNFGLWFRNKIHKNQFLDFGIELNFLKKPKEINYVNYDSIIHLESNKIGLKVGLRYSKVINFSKNNQNFGFEINSGIGWSVLYYKIPTYYENHKIKDDLDKKTNLNTIFLSQTFKLNVYDFGIFCTYYYTPYSYFKKSIEPNFGSHSISFGIVYRQ